jgi:hypothetical protein
MTGRAQTILKRLPAHFEATRAGKQFEVVADAGAADFDTQAVALGRIRRSHRIGEAEELIDVLRIAALHRITRSELAMAEIRFATARALAAQLGGTGSPPADPDALAETLLALWGIAEAGPLQTKYAPPGSPPGDPAATRVRLLAHVADAVAQRQLIEVLRQRILRICGIHSRGNGTVQAILEGAANCLDLDIVSIEHSEDRYLHSAEVHDRIALTRPVATGGSPPAETSAPFAPAPEALIVEENPLWRFETGTAERHHAERFSVARKGFERAILQVRVTGLETRTVGPMFVNRDEGHGIGYAQAVAAGETLVFAEEGRALIGSSDVTSFAYAWKGACFAGEDHRASDFVFDGPGVDPERRAVFVQTFPDGALDSNFVFPHAGDSIPMPGIAVGETRFAVFVQQAHYSSVHAASPPQIVLVTPRTKVGFFDASVFAAGPGAEEPAAALVSLSWLERRAYNARVWIPMRFQRFVAGDDEGLEVKRRVVQALNRFRPAGVQLEVEYLDPRWVLGRGIALGEDSDEIAGPGTGTVLWSAPPEP